MSRTRKKSFLHPAAFFIILTGILSGLSVSTHVFAKTLDDTTTTVSDAVQVEVTGTFSTDGADKIMRTINLARYRACYRNEPKPNNSDFGQSSNGSLSLSDTSWGETPTDEQLAQQNGDYIPATWDHDLERMAEIRAVEASVRRSHTRPDGTSCFTAAVGNWASGECLAWASSQEYGIQLWLDEEDNYISAGGSWKSNTGHYFIIINPNNVSFGVASFYNPSYRRTAASALESSSVRSDDTAAIGTTGDTIQRIYVAPEFISSISLSAPESMEIGEEASAHLVADCSFSNEGSGKYPLASGASWSSTRSDIAAIDQTGTISAKNAGKTTITASSGSESKTADITVNRINIGGSRIHVSNIPSPVYNGLEQNAEFTLTDGTKVLEAETDYSVSYADTVNAGTATITATGLGNYTGSRTITYRISPRSIISASVTDPENRTYSGNAFTPSVSVVLDDHTLVKNKDYTLSYSDNINAGTAKVVVKGTGNYSGEIIKSFIISPASLSECTISLIPDQVSDSGRAVTPEISISGVNGKALVQGTDFTVTFSNNTKEGTASATITGKGNYSGTRTITFKIVDGIAIYKIQVNESYVYQGGAAEPPVTVIGADQKTLKEGTDYTVTYQNNRKPGTASVTVTGKGRYAGSKTATFRILFQDVQNSGRFYYNPVYWAADNGITSGLTPYLFGPENNCTRGQMVQFLYNMAGTPDVTGSVPFTDIPSGAFYQKALIWAVQNGITAGKTADLFAPNDTCTRGQMVTFLWNMKGKPAATGYSFQDIPENSYYRTAVIWAKQTGITSGINAYYFAPNDTCTRGQMVTFLQNYQKD